MPMTPSSSTISVAVRTVILEIFIPRLERSQVQVGAEVLPYGTVFPQL